MGNLTHHGDEIESFVKNIILFKFKMMHVVIMIQSNPFDELFISRVGRSRLSSKISWRRMKIWEISKRSTRRTPVEMRIRRPLPIWISDSHTTLRRCRELPMAPKFRFIRYFFRIQIGPCFLLQNIPMEESGIDMSMSKA